MSYREKQSAAKAGKEFFHPCVINRVLPETSAAEVPGSLFPSSRSENALNCCLFVGPLVPLSPPRAVPGAVTLLASRYLCYLCPAVAPARKTALPEHRGLQELPCSLGCVISCRNVNNPFPRSHRRDSAQPFCPQVLLLRFAISAVAPVLGLSPFPCFSLKKRGCFLQ